MLCSDGLTDLVKDGEILEYPAHPATGSSPAQLINLANQRGGHDNITVVTLGSSPACTYYPPTYRFSPCEIAPRHKSPTFYGFLVDGHLASDCYPIDGFIVDLFIHSSANLELAQAFYS